MQIILALDGHDGTGKTTLAKNLAEALGGKYIRPYGKPYGPSLLKASEVNNFKKVLRIGREAYAWAIKNHADGCPLVFDRLWVTLFTLLPESFQRDWHIRPPTAVCWIDFDTTLSRIMQRNEEEYPESWHEHYIGLYKALAEKYNCELVNTEELNQEQALEKLVEWAHLSISNYRSNRYKKQNKQNHF